MFGSKQQLHICLLKIIFQQSNHTQHGVLNSGLAVATVGVDMNAHPVRGWHTLILADSKREVGANSEEVDAPHPLDYIENSPPSPNNSAYDVFVPPYLDTPLPPSRAMKLLT